MKNCTKCKEVKSKSEFSKHKSTKDSLQTQCKSCAKRYRQENKEKTAVRSKVWREVNKEKTAVRSKVWRESNKEHQASFKKTWYEVNKDRLVVTQKAYQEINKEKIAVKKKAHYEKNKEHILVKSKTYREENKEKIAVRDKVWYKANQERWLVYSHKRRALKRNAEGGYMHTDITTLLTTQDSKCVYCKTDLIMTGKGKYHIDHIMPLFLGGNNFTENLQLLCPACNLSKGHKHPDIYEKQINHNQNKEL
jgi:5-methylcytosine-specific restriction endonuclease McrA